MITSARNERMDANDDLNGQMRQTGPTFGGSLRYWFNRNLQEENPLVVRASPDGSVFAVGLDNGIVKMFKVGDKPTLVYVLPKKDQDTLCCTDIRFVPQGPKKQNHLVATYASGHVRLWHYTSLGLVAGFREEQVPRPGEVLIRRQSTTTTTAMTTARGTGSRSKTQQQQLEPVYNAVMTCAVSCDGLRCVSGGEDGCIRVYDLVACKEISRCYSTHTSDKVDGHVMRICAVHYHPRGTEEPSDYGHIFVSGGWDDSVQIWDDRHCHSLWQYFGPHICGSDALDIDGEKNHILVSSWRRDKTILEVWKFNEDAVAEFADTHQVNKSNPEYIQYARPITKSYQDKNSPTMGYVSQWLTDNYIVFGGSNHHMLKIIDQKTFNTVGIASELPNGVYSVACVVPDVVSERRPIRIAFCSGSRVFLTKMERQ